METKMFLMIFIKEALRLMKSKTKYFKSQRLSENLYLEKNALLLLTLKVEVAEGILEHQSSSIHRC